MLLIGSVLAIGATAQGNDPGNTDLQKSEKRVIEEVLVGAPNFRERATCTDGGDCGYR